MTIDEAIEYHIKVATQRAIADKEMGVNDKWNETKFMTKRESEQIIADNQQLAKWLKELKEARRLVAQLKAKLCDSSEYCAYCDELDMSERSYFTCKYKKKKISAVCHWQSLTPAHFDDIPWTKNEAEKLIGDE